APISPARRAPIVRPARPSPRGAGRRRPATTRPGRRDADVEQAAGSLSRHFAFRTGPALPRPSDVLRFAVFAVLTRACRRSRGSPSPMARLLRILCFVVAPAMAVLGALPAAAQLFNPFEALFGPPR